MGFFSLKLAQAPPTSRKKDITSIEDHLNVLLCQFLGLNLFPILGSENKLQSKDRPRQRRSLRPEAQGRSDLSGEVLKAAEENRSPFGGDY